MYPFFRQIARYLPHHRSENASKTHPKSSHDKFKTASKSYGTKFFFRELCTLKIKTLCLRVSVFDKTLCLAPLIFR